VTFNIIDNTTILNSWRLTGFLNDRPRCNILKVSGPNRKYLNNFSISTSTFGNKNHAICFKITYILCLIYFKHFNLKTLETCQKVFKLITENATK
jgi:hypothetical protein